MVKRYIFDKLQLFKLWVKMFWLKKNKKLLYLHLTFTLKYTYMVSATCFLNSSFLNSTL